MLLSADTARQLTVKLIERHPVALLQTPAGHQLIDEAGVIIDGANVLPFHILWLSQERGSRTHKCAAGHVGIRA